MVGSIVRVCAALTVPLGIFVGVACSAGTESTESTESTVRHHKLSSSELWSQYRHGLERAVLDDPLNAALGQCTLDSVEIACAEPITNLLYSALSRFSLPFLVNHKEGHFSDALSLEARQSARATFYAIFTGSTDLLSRLSALVLLHATPEDPNSQAQSSLPASVYRDLATLTPPEAELLLEARVSRIPDAESARFVAEIGADPSSDPRVRLAAIHSLGSSDYPEQVAFVVTRLEEREGAIDPSLLVVRGLPTAIADCGAKCFPILERMSKHTDDAMRWVANATLRLMPDESRNSFLQLESLPTSVSQSFAAFAEEQQVDVSSYYHYSQRSE
jgi:hypothetical protein